MELTGVVIGKILVLISFLMIVGFTEKLYNNSLFEYSLQLIPQIQKNLPKFFIYFFKFVSYSCYLEVLFPLIIIIFNICSLQTNFILLNALFGMTFVANLLKLIYHNPRPFWINPDIIPYKCEVDYGNPSGHAVAIFSFYLVMFHLLYDNYIKNKHISFRILYWLNIISFSILVIFSRLVLGVHSLNQVIFGTLIGLAIYFVFFYILEVQNYNSDEFLAKFQVGSWYTFFFILKYLAGVVKCIIIYMFVKFNNTPWERQVDKACPNKVNGIKYHYFDFGLTLTVFSCIGMILGMFVLVYLLDLRSNNADIIKIHALNNWNKTKISVQLLRIILTFIFISVITIPFYLILSTANSVTLKVVMIFGVLTFILFLSLFSLLIYLFIKVGLVNEDLLKEGDCYYNYEEKKELLNPESIGMNETKIEEKTNR